MPRGHVRTAIWLLLAFTVPAGAQRQQAEACRVVVPLTDVPGLREASALARGRAMPSRLFTFNDSGPPELAVLDENGVLLRRVAVRGAEVDDWEDVTSAQCANGPCLYVADIGNNDGLRSTVTLYRVPEPREGQPDIIAQGFDVAYPDGTHDAEAIFAASDGRLYLLTKQARGAELYAFPRALVADRVNRLEHVRTLSGGRGRDAFGRITDAEATADGRTVAVRTNDTLFVLPTDALIAGRLADASVFPLRRLNEPQGEGVAFAANGDVFLTSEGSGRRDAGTFARLACGLS